MKPSGTPRLPRTPALKPSGERSRPQRALLVAFFFSGAAGLIYEVAWVKSLGLFFGHTVYANATVLALFMGGLAAGSVWIGRRSDRSTRPLILYAWIEVAVACTGALSLLGLLALRHFYVPYYLALSRFPALILALQFLSACTVLLLPTFLMGGTLPVLVRSLRGNSSSGRTSSSRELGTGISRLYWVNTLGAATGTLAAGFFVIPQLGLRASVASAVGLNLLAATIAFHLGRHAQLPGVGDTPEAFTSASPVPSGETYQKNTWPLFLLVSFAIVGATAISYEIAWARLLATVLGSSTYAFTLMLTTFLAGMVLGSIFYERWATQHAVTLTTFAQTQTYTAIAALLVLVFFREFPAILPPILRATHQSFGGLVLGQFLVCTLALFPLTIVFGFNFPAVATLIAIPKHGESHSGQAVGLAYAANTSGAIFAALVTGFFLVPWAGSFRLAALTAVLNTFLAAALLFRSTPPRNLFLLVNAAVASCAVFAGWSSAFYDRALASFGTVLYWNQRSERLTLEERANLEDTIFLQDGLNATIAVSRSDSYVALKTNGKVDASSVDTATQLLLGHLGAVFHPNPRRVLVVGFGGGMTASALLRYPEVERLDCVEMEPAVLRAAPFLEQLNRGVLRDPRLHMVFEDARNALLTSQEHYDLIVSEPSNPWIAGIATLYTDEYYQAVRQHLAPGGIFVQWVQGYSLEPADFRMILATLVPHFADVTLWHSASADFLLLARTDLRPLDFDRSRALWGNTWLREDFDALGLSRPESWPVYFSLSDSEVRLLAQGGMHNTDDRTVLEYRAPHAMIGESHMSQLLVMINEAQNELLPTELSGSEKRATLEAVAQSSLGMVDPRAAEFVRALDRERPTASLELIRGRQALRENQVAKALEHFQQAAAMEPNNVAALLWLARAKHLTPGDTESNALLSQVLQRDPQNLKALAARAEFASQVHDWRGAAEAVAERIRVMNSPLASDYCRLGNFWARSGDLPSAERAFRTGIEKDPYSYMCHLELGEIARVSNRFDEARQNLEFVERHYPDATPGIYPSLAAVYRAQGNPSKGRQTLQKGRRIFPNDQTIARMASED